MKNLKGHIRGKGWGELVIYEPGDQVEKKVKGLCDLLTRTVQGNYYATFIIGGELYYFKASGCYFRFTDIEIRKLYLTLKND